MKKNEKNHCIFTILSQKMQSMKTILSHVTNRGGAGLNRILRILQKNGVEFLPEYYPEAYENMGISRFDAHDIVVNSELYEFCKACLPEEKYLSVFFLMKKEQLCFVQLIDPDYGFDVNELGVSSSVGTSINGGIELFKFISKATGCTFGMIINYVSILVKKDIWLNDLTSFHTHFSPDFFIGPSIPYIFALRLSDFLVEFKAIRYSKHFDREQALNYTSIDYDGQCSRELKTLFKSPLFLFLKNQIKLEEDELHIAHNGIRGNGLDSVHDYIKSEEGTLKKKINLPCSYRLPFPIHNKIKEAYSEWIKNQECAICYDVFENEDISKMDCCSGTFHKSCLKKQMTPRCPMCRSEIEELKNEIDENRKWALYGPFYNNDESENYYSE